MRRISKVKVLPGYRLELNFDDGRYTYEGNEATEGATVIPGGC
jgi:hypothetical protein